MSCLLLHTIRTSGALPQHHERSGPGQAADHTSENCLDFDNSTITTSSCE